MVGCKVTVKYYFDDGLDPVPMCIKINAYGMDVGGFAVAKAMTSAYKMLLCQLFSIPFASAGEGEGEGEGDSMGVNQFETIESSNKFLSAAKLTNGLITAKEVFQRYYNRFKLIEPIAERFAAEANFICNRHSDRLIYLGWTPKELDLCIETWDKATTPVGAPAGAPIEVPIQKATNETTQKAAETQEAKEPVRTKRKYTRRPKPAAETAEAGKADSPGPNPAA